MFLKGGCFSTHTNFPTFKASFCSLCLVSHLTLPSFLPSSSSILWQKSNETDSFYLSFLSKKYIKFWVQNPYLSTLGYSINQSTIRYYFKPAQPSPCLDLQCVGWAAVSLLISCRAHLAAKLKSRSQLVRKAGRKETCNFLPICKSNKVKANRQK